MAFNTIDKDIILKVHRLQYIHAYVYYAFYRWGNSNNMFQQKLKTNQSLLNVTSNRK